VPYLWAIEIFGILPILFHATLGAVIIWQGDTVQAALSCTPTGARDAARDRLLPVLLHHLACVHGVVTHMDIRSAMR
jgi:hypothetical protein